MRDGVLPRRARYEKQLANWRKHGKRLEREIPDEFIRVIVLEGWHRVGGEGDDYPQSDESQLTIPGIPPVPAARRRDNGYRSTDLRVCVKGRVLAMNKDRLVVETLVDELLVLHIVGGTTVLQPHLPIISTTAQVMTNCNGHKRLMVNATELLIEPTE